MNTPLLRVIVVVGVLAAGAFVIVKSSRSSRELPPSRTLEQKTSPPAATAPEAVPNQPAPSPSVSAIPSPEKPANPPAAPADISAKPSPNVPADAATASSRPPMPAPGAIAPLSAPAPASEADFAAVENDLEHVRTMVREYRDVVGENPVGTNAEIVKAVLGDNLKQAKIGVPENQGLNGKGELIDRWGTPYFFHQVSKTEMEIRSAGPDRVMWTGDDRQL